jgi:ACT domain-containing protein
MAKKKEAKPKKVKVERSPFYQYRNRLKKTKLTTLEKAFEKAKK